MLSCGPAPFQTVDGAGRKVLKDGAALWDGGVAAGILILFLHLLTLRQHVQLFGSMLLLLLLSYNCKY